MSNSAVSGPRVLLRQLRQIMAGQGNAQARLDAIVQRISFNMVAEVCSVYLLRAGEILELFATEGLNPDSVHQTTLSVGEGLIGHIAAHANPLNLVDAQAHPQFAYRPETGEEIYHSLLGVPIMRGGRVIGVLAVQNKTLKQYTEDDVEALQTVAMVVAELVSSEHMVKTEELRESSGNATLPHRAVGLVLADGLGQGIAVLHEPRIEVSQIIAEDVEAEQVRMSTAIGGLQQSVDAMLSTTDSLITGESREILEAYKMFAYDKGWLGRLKDAVSTGLTAEAAIKRVQDDTRGRMKEIADPYIRERLSDLDDLANRLYLHLQDGQAFDPHKLTEDTIVVARNMGAAELLDYDRKFLRGLILAEGTRNSHVAIVARALGIPVVGQCHDLQDRIEYGDSVLVDGEHGQVFLRPAEDVLEVFSTNVRLRNERQAKYAGLRDKDAITLDGVKILLNMNAGLLIDVEHFSEIGAHGIGLFRTELQFMVRSQMPKVDEQTKLYTQVMDKLKGKEIVFRTLDVGGDKVLPYLHTKEEENPALGWRAIRIGLDRPALLRSQLRAMVRAAADRELKVMFPMIAEVAEFQAAKAVLNKEIEHVRINGGTSPRDVKVGTMIEVPSIIWQLPHLLREVDFVSIGSNDLLQFFFAVDRGNPKLIDRFDSLSPSHLLMLRKIADDCSAADIPFSVCGEMAGRPLEALALMGLGFRDLSMSAESVGPVKEMIRSVDLNVISGFVRHLSESNDRSVRTRLKQFAQDHGVII